MTKQALRLAMVFVLLAMFVTGCGGNDVNWDQRIGVYTHEDAVNDYGPEESAQTLANGDILYFWHDYGARQWYNRLVLRMDPDNVLKAVELNERD